MLPEHIAIIMDGNGRWAKKRNLPRIAGHRSGAKTANTIIKFCLQKGIKALTLYTFSTENWKRSEKEVAALMKLLGQNLDAKAKDLEENNVRFNIIGRLDKFPPSLADKIRSVIDRTSANSGMILSLALDYGGRQEILDAVKSVCEEGNSGHMDIASMREEDFEKFLYTAGIADPDLVIRTSGEMRLSNFLLWQSAYAEFYITNTLWPDFDEVEMEKAIREYSSRDRRLGG